MSDDEKGVSSPPEPDPYDYDALVARLKRNALVSLIAVAILVAAIWREPMTVVGALLGGGAVLMALMLYGIFALPGVHPIPVALGLSILVLAVVIETVSEILSAPTSRE